MGQGQQEDIDSSNHDGAKIGNESFKRQGSLLLKTINITHHSII